MIHYAFNVKDKICWNMPLTLKHPNYRTSSKENYLQVSLCFQHFLILCPKLKVGHGHLTIWFLAQNILNERTIH